MFLRQFLKFVVRELVRRYLEVLEHVLGRLDHHRRTAEVILDSSGADMTIEVLVLEGLVYITRQSRPVVFRLGFREYEVIGEIWKLFSKSLEVVTIEDFLQRPRAVPEADATRGLQRFQQVRNVRSQRRHA